MTGVKGLNEFPAYYQGLSSAHDGENMASAYLFVYRTAVGAYERVQSDGDRANNNLPPKYISMI